MGEADALSLAKEAALAPRGFYSSPPLGLHILICLIKDSGKKVLEQLGHGSNALVLYESKAFSL